MDNFEDIQDAIKLILRQHRRNKQMMRISAAQIGERQTEKPIRAETICMVISLKIISVSIKRNLMQTNAISFGSL